MTELARAILTRFAEVFPQSAHYRGGRPLRLSGWERDFPRIVTDVEAKTEFLDAVDELIALGVVRPKWRRFRERDELEALYLTDPEQLYQLLGRCSPEALRDQMLTILDGPAWAGSVVVREQLRSLLQARHPAGVETPEALRDLGVLFALSPETTRGTALRALSVRLFSDSKRIESLLPVADRISQRAAGVRLSEALGLARTYPEVTIALRGSIWFGTAGWECADLPVTLPMVTAAAITRIQLDSAVAQAALSVENKETFYAAAERTAAGFGCLVYTGGHPNPAVLTVLKRLQECGAGLYHFGDLDPDGLLIFTELARGVPLEPFCMDVATFRRYRDHGYPLDDGRLQRLAPLLEPDAGASAGGPATAGSPAGRLPPALLELAREILATRTGVEQEVVPLPPV